MGQLFGHNLKVSANRPRGPVVIVAAADFLLVTARNLLAAPLLLFALGAGAQGLPDLGDISSATISEQQERTIGNRIMREVRNDPAYIDDPEVADYITSLGNRLMAGADVPRRDVDYFVIQEDTINAFALVGGHIGIHSGLFTLTQSESELAGVVAHEIAHILQKHQARSIAGQSRASWTSLAAMLVAILAARGSSSQSGQVTEAAAATAGALQVQTMLDYTREHEREADRVGLTLLERAGLDTRGMQGFFERMLRNNRLNEYKGAPSYLRTHPLTTERIADMQDRIEHPGSGRPGVFTSSRVGPDSFEYRLVRARLRANAGSASEAVTAARALLADTTVVRPREDVYNLALALRRARDFGAAWETLEPLRKGEPHPAFERLAAQILADQGKAEDAIAVYRAALKAHPRSRALLHGYFDLLLQRGRPREVLAELEEKLRTPSEDSRLYELQARAYEATGKPISQHRAQAEALYRRGNLQAAVQQLETAVKMKGSDFYELSSAESRLRELRALLEIERSAEKALKIS
jgi:predicted Zn-dependent protease